MNIDVARLEIDSDRTGPLDQYGSVWSGRLGTFWTRPVRVPLASLEGLDAKAISRERLRSVRSATHAGRELPPIEIAISPDGRSGWMVDGNHRLVAARRRGDRTITVVFTIIGQ